MRQLFAKNNNKNVEKTIYFVRIIEPSVLLKTELRAKQKNMRDLVQDAQDVKHRLSCKSKML